MGTNCDDCGVWKHCCGRGTSRGSGRYKLQGQCFYWRGALGSAPETTCAPLAGVSAAQSRHLNPESHGSALSLPDK